MSAEHKKREAIAEALHDGFAPSNQVQPWRISDEGLRSRSRIYADDFERFLRRSGYKIVPVRTPTTNTDGEAE